MSYLTTPSSHIITHQEDDYLPTITSMVKDKRSKCLAFAPTNNHVLVSGHGQCVRLYSGPLRRNDVVIAVASGGAISTIGGAHLKHNHLYHYPGNQTYLAVLCQHHAAFLQATGFERRSIVSLIQEELRTADPPARFIARRFGIPEGQQWIGMNDDQVAKLIQRDLLHNLVDNTTSAANDNVTNNNNNNNNNNIAIRSTHPQQSSRHQRPLPLRIVSPVVFEQAHHGGSTTTTNNNTVPAVMSNNVVEFLALPCMAVQRSRLSDYNQGLLNSMELFQATEQDVFTGRKGKHAITLGQLGLRCRHCAAVAGVMSGGINNINNMTLPAYAVSFPGRIKVMEFNYFLIAAKHFVGGTCVHIPHELRSQLLSSKRLSGSQTKKRGGTGIQAYFSQVAVLCGIQDTPGGMKIPSSSPVVVDNEGIEEPVICDDEDGATMIVEASANNSDETTMVSTNAVETPSHVPNN